MYIIVYYVFRIFVRSQSDNIIKYKITECSVIRMVV